MAKKPPKLVALNHDDSAAKRVGTTGDGRQFFLTEPFVPAIQGRPGREFLALYLFDKGGGLLEAKIEDLGPRNQVDESQALAICNAMLASLGDVTFGRIMVAPFRIQRFGVEFGFILRPPEDSGECWWVIVEPGNYMAFHPPWDSGEYDT